jgi:hypothetical protein
LGNRVKSNKLNRIVHNFYTSRVEKKIGIEIYFGLKFNSSYFHSYFILILYKCNMLCSFTNWWLRFIIACDDGLFFSTTKDWFLKVLLTVIVVLESSKNILKSLIKLLLVNEVPYIIFDGKTVSSWWHVSFVD